MEALRKARIRIFGQPADRSTVPNTVIFITKSMRKEHEIFREAGKLKLSGTNIIGIGKIQLAIDSLLIMCQFNMLSNSTSFQNELVHRVFLYFVGMDLSDSDKGFLKTAVSPPMLANSFFLPNGESLTSLTDTVMTYLCQGILWKF